MSIKTDSISTTGPNRLDRNSVFSTWSDSSTKNAVLAQIGAFGQSANPSNQGADSIAFSPSLSGAGLAAPPLNYGDRGLSRAESAKFNRQLPIFLLFGSAVLLFIYLKSK